MRRPPISLLAALCVCLLGSECEIRVSNRPPPQPPPDEGEPPDPPDSGLVIVVREGDVLREPPDAETVEALTDVSPAVATSFLPVSVEALTSVVPDTSEVTERVSDPGPLAVPVPAGVVGVAREVPAGPSSAIPEPQGLLLFAAGLALSTLVGRGASNRSRSTVSRSSRSA